VIPTLPSIGPIVAGRHAARKVVVTVSGDRRWSNFLSNSRSIEASAGQAAGPGLITGAADDDPSGIATYSQAGAQFGYSMLWTVLFTYPLMVGIQMVSARLGCITGQGLAANVKAAFPRQLSVQCDLRIKDPRNRTGFPTSLARRVNFVSSMFGTLARNDRAERLMRKP